MVIAISAVLALTACAAPYDGDGEEALSPAVAARPLDPEATPVVVDTDLGGDDLAALAFLLRHPAVDVEAITVAGAGLVGCDPGVDLVADLLTALDEQVVPVACTTAASGPGALDLPEEWRRLAATGTGLPRSSGTLSPEPGSASSVVAELARQHDDLVLVALGPMTMAAELASTSPAAFARLAGVHAMGGSVRGRRSTAWPSGTSRPTRSRSRPSWVPACRSRSCQRMRCPVAARSSSPRHRSWARSRPRSTTPLVGPRSGRRTRHGRGVVNRHVDPGRHPARTAGAHGGRRRAGGAVDGCRGAGGGVHPSAGLRLEAPTVIGSPCE